MGYWVLDVIGYQLDASIYTNLYAGWLYHMIPGISMDFRGPLAISSIFGDWTEEGSSLQT